MPDSSEPRWPHLRPGWLDPNVSLAGWRTTADVADAEDVLRAAASASGRRIEDRDVAEVLDALSSTDEGRSRAFRFGPSGPRAFSQIWIGLVRAAPSTVTIFILADAAFVERLAEALSLAGFPSGEKRTEYDMLCRFFLAGWEWQWNAAPGSGRLRASAPPDFDPARTAERMRRILADPRSPFLELLRGVRRRALELLDETSELDGAAIDAADRYLAARRAPTLTEMRRRYRTAPGAG